MGVRALQPGRGAAHLQPGEALRVAAGRRVQPDRPLAVGRPDVRGIRLYPQPEHVVV